MRAPRRRCSPPPTRRCIGKRALDSLFPLGWSHYLAGGLLLGAGISLLFVFTGLIGGMSTVFTTVWSFFSRAPYFREERFISSRVWRLVYAAGPIPGAPPWPVPMCEPLPTHGPAGPAPPCRLLARFR